MPKKEELKGTPVPGRYRHVQIASLDRGRRGKHYDLVQKILKELKSTDAGSALQIPLDQVGNIGLANLRSAVHRGASSEGIAIQTLADADYFYVWNTSSPGQGNAGA